MVPYTISISQDGIVERFEIQRSPSSYTGSKVQSNHAAAISYRILKDQSYTVVGSGGLVEDRKGPDMLKDADIETS